jgi:demethylmenaquinone methyltransferase / 2-methoxy-6-polyprenyl-1,4-benzoquinol methylase
VTLGTHPPGAGDERQAARWVQDMFAEVAPRYDFLNHLLSFNVDRGWRKVLRDELASTLARKDARVLDLCCGTGDVLLDLQSSAQTNILGADFCHPMLLAAQRKVWRRGFRSPLFEADALVLPLRDGTLDAIAISFGFRNLASYEMGLTELHRVLKPGGMLAILEFSHPPGWLMKNAYGFYSRVLLPAIGSIVSGSRDAYTYLPESIGKFPSAAMLRQMMIDTGFHGARFQLLTSGVAALHLGTKN